MSLQQVNSAAVWSERSTNSRRIIAAFLRSDGYGGYEFTTADGTPDALLLDDGMGGFERVDGSTNPALLDELFYLDTGSGVLEPFIFSY
jgi:hypothetical protein